MCVWVWVWEEASRCVCVCGCGCGCGCDFVHTFICTFRMPSGPIVGIATFFGLLSVITTTSTLCLFVCVVHLFKKSKSDKGTLCAFIHCMYFKGGLCLIMCFDLLAEFNESLAQ